METAEFMLQDYIYALFMCYKFFVIVVGVQLIANTYIIWLLIVAERTHTKEFLCVAWAFTINLIDFFILSLILYERYTPAPFMALFHVIRFWLCNLYLVWYFLKVCEYAKKYFNQYLPTRHSVGDAAHLSR